MKRFLIKVRYFIEYIFVVGLFFLFKPISYKVKLEIGKFLGRLVYFLDSYHRFVAYTNLKIAFPEKTDEELQKILKLHFEELGKFGMEFLHLPSMKKKFLNKYIKPLGLEIYKEWARNSGGLAILGHFGAWEVAGLFYASLGFPTYVIVQRQSNPYITKFIERIRREAGEKIIYNNQSIYDILKPLKENAVVGILPDQDAGRQGVFVDFFGIKTSTAKGPAILTLISKKPFMIIFPIREDGGKIRMIAKGPYKWEPTGDRQKDIEGITALWISELEKEVRKHPEQYFWVHRRFKTAPNGERRNIYDRSL